MERSAKSGQKAYCAEKTSPHSVPLHAGLACFSDIDLGLIDRTSKRLRRFFAAPVMQRYIEGILVPVRAINDSCGSLNAVSHARSVAVVEMKRVSLLVVGAAASRSLLT